MILGLGCDLVALPALAEQVGRPGSHFAEQVLTARELRTVRARVSATTGSTARPDSMHTVGRDVPRDLPPSSSATTDVAFARHLGGRWAAKEAVIKAWSAALAPAPPPINIESVDWREIEVVQDHWDRPSIALHGRIADEVAHSVDPDGHGLSWHVSISHDGDYAMAVVVMESHTLSG